MSFSFLIVTSQQTFRRDSTRQFSGLWGFCGRPPHLPPVKLAVLLLHLVDLLLEPPDLLDDRHLDHLVLLCLLCLHVHCVSVRPLLNISLSVTAHGLCSDSGQLSALLSLTSSHSTWSSHIIITPSFCNF